MLSLNQFRQWCQKRTIPIISSQTQSVLSLILEERKPNYCIEIGSAVGYSSTVIASIIHNRGGYLHSFEIAYNVYTQALYHTKDRINLSIYPRNYIHVADTIVTGPYDFVFIDAQKAQYDQYLMKIRPLLHKESVVVCDDVIKFQNKLSPLYRYLEKKQIFYHIIHTEDDDGIMIIGQKPVVNKLIEAINQKKDKLQQ